MNLNIGLQGFGFYFDSSNSVGLSGARCCFQTDVVGIIKGDWVKDTILSCIFSLQPSINSNSVWTLIVGKFSASRV